MLPSNKTTYATHHQTDCATADILQHKKLAESVYTLGHIDGK